jgi:hypothetical protein
MKVLKWLAENLIRPKKHTPDPFSIKKEQRWLKDLMAMHNNTQRFKNEGERQRMINWLT